MNFFDYALPFLLLLGVLIFFHELGHFAVAKWCGVKVEKFSLGFGPALLQKRIGETTYALSALPLGGFVKMLGELPGETLDPTERDRAFNFKPPWQRIAIALAGPGMNLVLPVFLIAGAVMVGKPEFTARIGGVEPDSLAARAGLLPGDRVLAVDGRAVEWWFDLAEALRSSSAPEVRLEVDRAGQRLSFELLREREDGDWSPAGITPSAPAAVVSVIPGSAAQGAGFETADRIVRLGGLEIADRFALEAELARAAAPLEAVVTRRIGGKDEERIVTLRELPEERTLAALGLGPLDLQIQDVQPLTPARAAGLEPGDIPLAVDGRPIHAASQLIESVRASGGKRLELSVLRDGATERIEVEPAQQPVPGKEGIETHYALGVTLGSPLVGGEQRDRIISNPFAALAFGLRDTAEATLATAGAFAELFRGSVGLTSLAGPIGIGAVAADKFRASWVEFVSLMVLISINLALLNLLPIPVLDGGTIVLTVAEWLRGGPLPLRARDWAQTVGLSFILLLMGVAFWNDLWRIVRNLG
jgi:regulator of sigma E protease